MHETKPYHILKHTLTQTFHNVKANKGTYAIDEETIEEYEEYIKENLYKLRSLMSSGSYLPNPFKAVPIPKKLGGTRTLGIPTVEDRIAQMVSKLYLELELEPIFYEDSYGYRPSKSAVQILQVIRKRCWRCFAFKATANALKNWTEYFSSNERCKLFLRVFSYLRCIVNIHIFISFDLMHRAAFDFHTDA